MAKKKGYEGSKKDMKMDMPKGMKMTPAMMAKMEKGKADKRADKKGT